MDLFQRALQTNTKLFQNFEFIFEFLAKKRIFFKGIARREYWSKCNVLYINGFVSTRSTNEWKAFFKFRIRFRIISQKQKNIQRITRLGFMQARWGRYLCWSIYVLVQKCYLLLVVAPSYWVMKTKNFFYKTKDLVKSYSRSVNYWALISLCFIYKQDWKHLIYNKCLVTLPRQSVLIYILIDFGTN